MDIIFTSHCYETMTWRLNSDDNSRSQPHPRLRIGEAIPSASQDLIRTGPRQKDHEFHRIFILASSPRHRSEG
jgi:hypothetical protein